MGISVFNSAFAHNRTEAALSFQAEKRPLRRALADA
jgi:hypothetical protein